MVTSITSVLWCLTRIFLLRLTQEKEKVKESLIPVRREPKMEFLFVASLVATVAPETPWVGSVVSVTVVARTSHLSGNALLPPLPYRLLESRPVLLFRSLPRLLQTASVYQLLRFSVSTKTSFLVTTSSPLMPSAKHL